MCHTGVQQQKTLKQTNEAVIRLDLEKKQAVRKADREHRTMLQYKTLLAESKTPLLLAQKEIASLQKELDGFRKAVDAKAKERDAMERAAKFAKAETEKVAVRVLYLCTIILDHTSSGVVSGPILGRFGPRRGRAAAVEPRRDASATPPRWRAVRPHAIAATLQRRPTAFPALGGRRRAYAPRESRGTPRTGPNSTERPPPAS